MVESPNGNSYPVSDAKLQGPFCKYSLSISSGPGGEDVRTLNRLYVCEREWMSVWTTVMKMANSIKVTQLRNPQFQKVRYNKVSLEEKLLTCWVGGWFCSHHLPSVAYLTISVQRCSHVTAASKHWLDVWQNNLPLLEARAVSHKTKHIYSLEKDLGGEMYPFYGDTWGNSLLNH